MKKQIIKQLVLGATLMGSLLAPMVVKAEEYPGGVNVYYEDQYGDILNGNPEDIDSNDIVINDDVGYGLGLVQTKDELIELKDSKYSFIFIGNWSIIRYLKEDNVENGYISDIESPIKSMATTTYKYRYKNNPELHTKKMAAMISNVPQYDRDIIEFVNNHIITKNVPDHDLLWFYDHRFDDYKTFDKSFGDIKGIGDEETKVLYKYNAADDDYTTNVNRDLKKIYEKWMADTMTRLKANDASSQANSGNSGSSAGGSSGGASTSRSTRSKRSVDVATTVDNAGTWTKEGNNWKLIKPDGSIARGWVMDNGKWYFLDPVSGNMRIGWSKDGDNWYFLNPDGSMATNWVHHGNSWYYLQGSGVMARGWIKYGNDWYFLSESGSMLKSTLTPDGYKLDASGKWVQ